MVYAIIKALRIEQWLKNLVVFAGLIFANSFRDTTLVLDAALAFIFFCLASSAIYLINDICDIEKDRQHPAKSSRPIASGQLSRTIAGIIAAVLIIISLLGAILFLNQYFFIAVACYVILILLYSISLKKIVIIDVMTIAAGFVLRAVGGAVAINVEISPWLIVCTTLLALFLGFGKRRHELVLLGDNAGSHRDILKKYSIYFLDQLISIVTAATIVAYSIYTLYGDPVGKLGVKHLELTIPFVIYGVFRYLYLIHQECKGGSPTRILYTDLPILICVLMWISSIFVLMAIS